MAEMLEQMSSWLTLLPRISLGNILEIVIISFLVYEILVWIKNTRAWNLLKGLLVILMFVVFAAVFHLTVILWILENTTTIAVTALLVIFQPELRKALEQLGSRNILSNILSDVYKRQPVNAGESSMWPAWRFTCLLPGLCMPSGMITHPVPRPCTLPSLSTC